MPSDMPAQGLSHKEYDYWSDALRNRTAAHRAFADIIADGRFEELTPEHQAAFLTSTQDLCDLTNTLLARLRPTQ